MRIPRTHRWDLSVAEARRLQRRLATTVETKSRLPAVHLVAGADVAYTTDGRHLLAAVVVLALPTLEIVEHAVAEGRVTFPYVPGLLGFREAPVVLRACAALRRRPDVLVCDGQGMAHPRRFGLACHLGYCLGLPTVGCAKTRLLGTHAAVGTARGRWAWLVDGRERLGMVLRTRADVRPVFVSPGFAIGFRDAAAVVLRTAVGFRLPEPTRQAHLLVNAVRRGERPGVWGGSRPPRA